MSLLKVHSRTLNSPRFYTHTRMIFEGYTNVTLWLTYFLESEIVGILCYLMALVCSCRCFTYVHCRCRLVVDFILMPVEESEPRNFTSHLWSPVLRLVRGTGVGG